ncbi:MAG: SDR family oxidoreductase [Myxococcota bacterium]|nr:SDR family oxidoreductase [Myxococcota bacterium]
MWLRDKVVLITGGSRGVGEAVAVACAKAGAKLALAAKTMEPHPKLPGTLHTAAANVEAAGGEAMIVQVDVRFEDQVQAMVDAVIERFGRIDVLVNNAGAIHLGPMRSWTLKKYDLVHDVNVRGSFLCAKAVIPKMREQGGGHILMMSPPINPAGGKGKAPYLNSKIGMTLLAQAIDAEEPTIAGHALWPVTAIKTAATVNNNLGTDEDYRTVDILAEATVALLDREPTDCVYKDWLDEEVLRELRGVQDFSAYNVVPGASPSPWSIQLVDPDWESRGS